MTTKILRKGLLGVVAAMVGVGCNGQTFIGASGGQGGAGTGGFTGGGVGGQYGVLDGGYAADAPPEAPPACPAAGVTNTPTTIADMRAALSRDWILCSPTGIFDAPQVGLRVTSDDHWAFLERGADGVVAAGSGADFTGTVQYQDTSSINPPPAPIQVDFTRDTGGGNGGFAVITKNPTMLIIDTTMDQHWRYVLPDGS